MSASDVTGYKVGVSKYLSEEDVQRLERAMNLPDEVIPQIVYGKVIAKAKNKRWVYCAVDNLPNKTPVMIPSRISQNSLLGKRIKIERIRHGQEYRHRYTK